jgi:hypothetical protein
MRGSMSFDAPVFLSRLQFSRITLRVAAPAAKSPAFDDILPTRRAWPFGVIRKVKAYSGYH